MIQIINATDLTPFSPLVKIIGSCRYGGKVERRDLAAHFAQICPIILAHLRFVYLPNDCEQHCHRAVKINPRCRPMSNFGHIIGHPLPPFGTFLGENKDGGGEEGEGRMRGVEEEPLSPYPLECFAALLRATELRSVELIVVNVGKI